MLCPSECSYAFTEAQTHADSDDLIPSPWVKWFVDGVLDSMGGRRYSRFFTNGEWSKTHSDYVPLAKIRVGETLFAGVDTGVLIVGPRGIGELSHVLGASLGRG